MLELRHIRKEYSTKVAVDDVSLDIPEGSIFGLLGPNGAGKTSIIRMITSITRPDSGTITFQGQPLTEMHQRQIGYMPEERGLYRKMRVREQLVYLLRLKGLKAKEAAQAADHWLQRFELGGWANRKVSELSKGMQQKVQFIATVAHNPVLLILDEPFSGLDPLNSQLIEEVMHDLNRGGTTVIFSTHRMEQVEQVCEQIALINNGRIVLEGPIRQLRRQFRQPVFLVETETELDSALLPSELEVLKLEGHSARLRASESLSRNQVLGMLAARLDITRFEHETPSLRDIFISTVQATQAPEPQPVALPLA